MYRSDADLARETDIIEAMAFRTNYFVMSAEEDRWEHYQRLQPDPEIGELSEVDPVYYISYTRKRRFRRLHLLQGCWRGPGHGIGDISIEMDFRDLEYDSFCRDCWPLGDGPDIGRDSRRLLEDDPPIRVPSSVSSEAESSSTCSDNSAATPSRGVRTPEPEGDGDLVAELG